MRINGGQHLEAALCCSPHRCLFLRRKSANGFVHGPDPITKRLRVEVLVIRKAEEAECVQHQIGKVLHVALLPNPRRNVLDVQVVENPLAVPPRSFIRELDDGLEP